MDKIRSTYIPAKHNPQQIGNCRRYMPCRMLTLLKGSLAWKSPSWAASKMTQIAEVAWFFCRWWNLIRYQRNVATTSRSNTILLSISEHLQNACHHLVWYRDRRRHPVHLSASIPSAKTSLKFPHLLEQDITMIWSATILTHDSKMLPNAIRAIIS